MRKSPNTIIIVAAAVAVAAAVLLTRKQEETTAKRFETKKLFEAVDIDQLGEVQIVDGDETITLRKVSKKEWGVASRANFPVDDERLRRLVLSVLGLEVVDRLTSDPAKYPRLGVGDEPENGKLLLRDGEGQVLAGLYLGKRREPKDTQGGFGPPRGQFVRAESDPAVYVSNDALTLDKQPTQWLKRDLLSVPVEELSRIEVDHPAAAEDFVLVRHAPEDPFELETAVPAGRKLKPGALGSVSRALANLTLEDVVAREAPETQAVAFEVLYRASGDGGLIYEVEAAQHEGKYYVRLDADRLEASGAEEEQGGESAGAAPSLATAVSVEAQVEEFNARHSNWIYEIQKYSFDNLAKQLSDLVEEDQEDEPPQASDQPSSGD